jgi:hypothetical protein
MVLPRVLTKSEAIATNALGLLLKEGLHAAKLPTIKLTTRKTV